MSSIRKRGNSYQITVSNGRDITGRQIIETATFTPDPARTEKQNQKALEKFAFEFEEKVKSGKYLDGEKMLYKDFVAFWIKDYAEKQLQQTSIERCESSLNSLILPELGHLKLARIQPLHIQAFYNKLMEQGYTINGHHKQYKANTIKRIHQIISSTLNTAVRWQLIETNPCCRIKPPKQKRNDYKTAKNKIVYPYRIASSRNHESVKALENRAGGLPPVCGNVLEGHRTYLYSG